MNCPECGALNPPSADFCSLCLTPLRAPEPVEAGQPATGAGTDESRSSPDAPAGADEGASDAASTDAAGPASTDAAGPASTHGRFRKTDEGMEWSCDRCETWNPLEVLSCTVCGRSFREQLTGTSDLFAPAADPARIRNLSLLLPGLGHVLMGDAFMGAARMIVALLWLLGGVVLVLEAGSAGQSPAPALPLLLGAVVMWAVTYLDASTLAAGRRQQLLDARRFLWLFVGIMVASLVMFFPGFLSARS